MSSPFIRAYEFEKRYDLERLKVTLQKAEHAYKTYEPETIDFCKSALECICKTILQEKDSEFIQNNIDDLPKLIKGALDCLSYKNSQIIGNISGLTSGLANLRNNNTIAGHGMGGTHPLPTKTEIVLFVMNFNHIVEMMILLSDDDDIDIRSTKINFSTLEEALNLSDNNAEVDRSVDVRYEQEEGIIYIDGKDIRPSELMYNYDRTNYAQRLESISDRQFDEISNQLTALLEKELYEHFEGFFPGHYGVDGLDIWFTEHKFDQEAVTVFGVVSASARLGSSSERDGIDMSYESGFKAAFIFYPEVEEYELESLKLDIVDWVQPEINANN